MQQLPCGCLQNQSAGIPLALIYRFCHDHAVAADREVALYLGTHAPRPVPVWPYVILVVALLLGVLGVAIFIPSPGRSEDRF